VRLELFGGESKFTVWDWNVKRIGGTTFLGRLREKQEVSGALHEDSGPAENLEGLPRGGR